MGYHKYSRKEKPRQEISQILKYVIFFINFIFWACGIICIGLGIYLYSNDFRPVLEAADFLLNPSILLIVCGCIIFLIAFLGCTGALREHVCLLKLFSLCLFFAYVCLVILAFVVFILFYSDAKTGLSIQTVLQSAVKKYHNNKNMADIMDTVQMQLSCCGATALGYKDWNENSLYNCSIRNESPEHCAVPYTCCKRNPKNEAEVPNIMCGFGAQNKSITEIQNLINTDGCLHPLQKSFEGHAVIIGAVIGAIIIPVCLSVTFANILAKQIEHQRRLLAKEARKEERRRRKDRLKHRADPLFTEVTAAGLEANNKTTIVVEQDDTDDEILHAVVNEKKSTKPNRYQNKQNKKPDTNHAGPSHETCIHGTADEHNNIDANADHQQQHRRRRIFQQDNKQQDKMIRKKRKHRGVSVGGGAATEKVSTGAILADGQVVTKKRRRHQRHRSQDPSTMRQNLSSATAAATATTVNVRPDGNQPATKTAVVEQSANKFDA